MGAVALRAEITANNLNLFEFLNTFAAFGNISDTYTSNNPASYGTIKLPYTFTNTFPSVTTDHCPVIHSFAPSPYNSPTSSDFGLVGYYASNSMAVQDTLVVSSGTEEWEILAVANNATASSSRIMLLARTV